MKSFLLKGKRPIIKWGLLPDGVMFKGKVPKGYNLAVSPSDNYIVIDVDRHDDIDGFEAIPRDLEMELQMTYNYPTKNDGKHYWMRYTGNKPLGNKTSGKGIDLRTNRGYVVWYPEESIEQVLEEHQIADTSEDMNYWLESLFSYI